MSDVVCADCEKVFDLNEVVRVPNGYVPRCRVHDVVEHMSPEDFAKWKARYVHGEAIFESHWFRDDVEGSS